MRAAAAVLVLATVVGCGGRSPAQRTATTRAEQARDVAKQAGLSSAIQDFMAHYAAVVGQEFVVTYTATNPTSGTVVLAQRPPDKRLDITQDRSGHAVTQSFFVIAQGSFLCVRDTGDWSCSRTGSDASSLGPLASGDAQRTVDELKKAQADYDFDVGTRAIAGVKASCLVTKARNPSPTAPAPASICISPEGVPLLIESPGQSLTATRYTTQAGTSRFRLPSRPRLTSP